MGLNGENLFEAVNLWSQEGQFWGSEHSVFLGKWEVKPAQKRAWQRVLKGGMGTSERAHNFFLRTKLMIFESLRGMF